MINDQLICRIERDDVMRLAGANKRRVGRRHVFVNA
jgi:hypothetical protein